CAVDGWPPPGGHDAYGRRDQAGRAAGDALAQAGIDLAARTARQHGAELELGAPPHRQAGHNVLARPWKAPPPFPAPPSLQEAVGRDPPALARLPVGLVDHAAHAAVVIDVAV